MDLFTLIGLLFVLYILIYVVLLTIVDCDIRLLWNVHFGNSPDSLKGKVVWVTGASSGIGEFLSVELAKNGASVILSARSLVNLERVRDKCLDVGSPAEKIFILPMDVTETEKHREHFNRVIDRFGKGLYLMDTNWKTMLTTHNRTDCYRAKKAKLDILVNNAGRSQRAIWEDIELDVDREIFDLNVFSVISLSRLAVRHFKENGGGHVVVMSSVAGLFGPPFSASYSGAKHALHGYFKTLMSEQLGGNIAVSLLCPGPVFSNLLPACFTSKQGETFGQLMQDSDRRMTTERCAYLSAVAIANKLDEVWIGMFPVIPLTYLLIYLPNLAKFIARSLGTKGLINIRDSRQTVKKTD